MNDNQLNQPIDNLQVSLEAIGFLKRNQILTVSDLLHYTQEDLQLLDQSAADEVINALEQRFGLTLPLNDLQ